MIQLKKLIFISGALNSIIDGNNLLATIDSNLSTIPFPKQHTNYIQSIPLNIFDKKKNECAEIIMRSGDIIKGQVIEVGVSEGLCFQQTIFWEVKT